MLVNTRHGNNGEGARGAARGAGGPSLSRRSLLVTTALLGLAAVTLPARRAFAWSSWTNATSSALKEMGMGDCVHEDLVQISYARVLRAHAGEAEGPSSLLNPWAGAIQDGARYATIAGDVVDAGKGKAFADADDLAARLYRENLAYLRIGSFWNDAAANTLLDFSYSCYHANSIPTFSGDDRYAGAWDVGQHIWETNEKNKTYWFGGLDALVQFTMNDRNNFIHGMLSSTASHAAHLTQADVKKFALQWLGVAYEYARTGEVTATSDVTLEQAEQIFKGFIDTYGQLDEDAHDMCVSLKVGSSEASIRLPRRRLRLRALGMMCHTLEDLWCPAHTCRSYYAGGSVRQNSILAFCNYKLQNGDNTPLYGYHIPFDRYALSDATNSPNWREALTRGTGAYRGTETLAKLLDVSMDCLDGPSTFFNTLGMNEAVACITRLLEHLYRGTTWDGGVREWVDTEIMPTYFDEGGQSLICTAGRRCLHTPTYLIAPLVSMRRAYRAVGLTRNHEEAIALAKAYDAWQQGTHLFFSGRYNTSASKYVSPGHEDASVWSDETGEDRLVSLVYKLHEGCASLDADAQDVLLSKAGCNGCHDMVSALVMVGGMLQEFSIDLAGAPRPDGDATMRKLAELRAFFASGLKGQGTAVVPQSLSAPGVLAAQAVFADEADESFVTANMVLEDLVGFEDGSYLIAVRNMESLKTSVMSVPTHTPGKDKLEEGLAHLAITYTLQTEFDGDPDYRYVVSDIDYSSLEENVYLVTGTVKSVSADRTGLVLDLNGTSEFSLAIREGMSVIPQVGAYICARYSFGHTDLELVAYDELDAPGELVKVTFPAERVVGSSMWLLTNEGDTGAEQGHRSYLHIFYGTADVRSLPREGQQVTVYYHDEAYGDRTSSGTGPLSAAAIATGPTGVSAQSASDELNDSATPGYLELGDEYGRLPFGTEVFHVANVIAGSVAEADAPPTITGGGGSPAQPTPAAPDSTSGGARDSAASGSSGQGTGSTATPGSVLPETGDPFAGVGDLPPAVAVATGAGALAYFAHRSTDEREDVWDD